MVEWTAASCWGNTYYAFCINFRPRVERRSGNNNNRQRGHAQVKGGRKRSHAKTITHTALALAAPLSGPRIVAPWVRFVGLSLIYYLSVKISVSFEHVCGLFIHAYLSSIKVLLHVLLDISIAKECIITNITLECFNCVMLPFDMRIKVRPCAESKGALHAHRILLHLVD